MYRYISKANLEKLIRDDRTAWVVCGVESADKEEYIENCLLALKSYGFNINLLTQCNIFKTDSTYNIVLTVRKQATLDDIDRKAIELWSNAMQNVRTAESFIRAYYSGCLIQKKTESIACQVNTGKGKRKITVILRCMLDSQGDIEKAIVVSPEFIDIHGTQLDVQDCKRNIPKLVEKLYGILYKNYKYTIPRCSYTIDGKLLKYTVVPTQSGIKLNLVS